MCGGEILKINTNYKDVHPSFGAERLILQDWFRKKSVYKVGPPHVVYKLVYKLHKYHSFIYLPTISPSDFKRLSYLAPSHRDPAGVLTDHWKIRMYMFVFLDTG